MIRPLRSSDISAITDIYELANSTVNLPVPADHFKKDAVNYASETIYLCENAVYELDGRVVGIISVSQDHIEGLFVHPEFFNKGVGQSLLSYFLNKKNWLQLQVYENNLKALNFYRKNGFKITGGGTCQITGLPYFEMVYEKP